MRAKCLASLSALACLVATSFATTAEAQYYGGGFYGGGPRRCLSSYGINDRLARSGYYPHALVGQSPDGRILYMQVSQGYRYLVATVDGCSGRILQLR